MNPNVEERLARLEAVEQIRALKMNYARLCDAGYPISELARIFAANAIWDGGKAFGRYEGWPEIQEFFSNAIRRIEWAMHYTVAGDINLGEDRRTATGTWYLWQPMTLDDTPVWLMGRYQDEYVNVDDRWIYTSLILDVQTVTPIDKGWVTERFAAAG